MTSSLVALAAAAAFAQTAHQHHPPKDAQEYALVLEDPARDVWQKPHEVVMALNLKSTDAVADIGAGTGYFSRRFAKHAAKVYAVDIDEKLLKIAAEKGPANLYIVLATQDDPKLAPQSVDIIFFCDVLHHIENRPAYYEKLKAALKPGGRIVNVDFYKKDLPLGPPLAMKLDEKLVQSEFEKAGFKLSSTLTILPYQYFQVFSR